MVVWVDKILNFWTVRTRELRDNANTLAIQMKEEGKRFKEELSDKMKGTLEEKDKEISELKERYERLAREKEEISDILKHRDMELKAVYAAPDYDGKFNCFCLVAV